MKRFGYLLTAGLFLVPVVRSPGLGGQAPHSTPLPAEEMDATTGGIESRITNVPVTGLPAPLPDGGVVTVEVVTQIGGANMNAVHVSAKTRVLVGLSQVDELDLPGTLTGQANVGASGTAGFYTIDLTPACQAAPAGFPAFLAVDVRASLGNDEFLAVASRYLSCP